jgi:hypothetical protein
MLNSYDAALLKLKQMSSALEFTIYRGALDASFTSKHLKKLMILGIGGDSISEL